VWVFAQKLAQHAQEGLGPHERVLREDRSSFLRAKKVSHIKTKASVDV
jgi:hypothetical protein